MPHSMTIFQLRGNGGQLDDNKNNEECSQIFTESENPANILCLVPGNRKVGAAYYNLQERLLYIFEEMLDFGPQYLATVNLYRDIKPKFVLSFGNIADEFIKVLIDTIVTGTGSTVTSDSVRSLPENFFLLPAKEYSYEICKTIISQLNLASIEDEPSEIKREIYIHSLINFEYRFSIQAIGTLIKYLEKNWAFFRIDKEDLQYLHIKQLSRKDHLLMDNRTFQALQVFSPRGHDANFKRGLQSTSREGLSIYKLFSANCKSKIGLVTLKSVLLNPSKNIDLLNKRLDFIHFVLQPNNREFIESLQDNMKHLGNDVNVILKRIQNFRASNRDWHVLYKTIYHSIFINEIAIPYIDKSTILVELNDSVSSDLISLENSIKNCLDFGASQNHGRPIIRFGLDEKLDEKKLRQRDIAKDVTAAARLAANNLPDFLNECAVVYLPEMGHLIAIKEWEPNCNPEQLESLGFRFMFTLRGAIHYKNPLCIELDRRLGDINAEIIDHENRILRRLSGFIMKYNKDIREPLKIIGLMDCLISMANAASQNAFVRPTLNAENIFEIEDGRHPLMEHIVRQCQPNNFYSGGKYSHMKIITGPNGSGKSMYLRQVALIIFMAHIGSYVPARTANIGLLDRILSRMQAIESASVRLSSFTIDVTQMTHALHNIEIPTSLILIDEFGRSTDEVDGTALLVGALQAFLKRKKSCPHVVVSTHLQQITTLLPKSSLVQYQKMEHAMENGKVYFLYKLTDGVSSSFALEIAESLGFDKDMIDRARYILNCLKNNLEIKPMENSARKFTPGNLAHLEIPEPDDEN